MSEFRSPPRRRPLDLPLPPWLNSSRLIVSSFSFHSLYHSQVDWKILKRSSLPLSPEPPTNLELTASSSLPPFPLTDVSRSLSLSPSSSYPHLAFDLQYLRRLLYHPTKFFSSSPRTYLRGQRALLLCGSTPLQLKRDVPLLLSLPANPLLSTLGSPGWSAEDGRASRCYWRSSSSSYTLSLVVVLGRSTPLPTTSSPIPRFLRPATPSRWNRIPAPSCVVSLPASSSGSTSGLASSPGFDEVYVGAGLDDRRESVVDEGAATGVLRSTSAAATRASLRSSVRCRSRSFSTATSRRIAVVVVGESTEDRGRR